MNCIYIGSTLANHGSELTALEISQKDSIENIVKQFLSSFEEEFPNLIVYDKDFKKLQWDATAESQGLKDGAVLYLANCEKAPSLPVHILVIGISVIALGLILLISISALFGGTGGDVPFDYGIIIDAGSTHTEIFLYKWSGSKFHGTGEVSQNGICRIEEGIAKGVEPEEIVFCVRNVTESLSSDVVLKTKLYLGATAGMRLRNITKPTEAHLILTAIKYALSTTDVQKDEIKIFRGEDEGLFSWITVNFLKKTLYENKMFSTFGALDLGGASTQIAFALSHEKNSSDVRKMKLYGNDYSILSKSFLCFGLSESFNRCNALGIFNGYQLTIDAPCLPDGYTKTLKISDLFDKPCLKSKKMQSHINDPQAKEIILKGTSNPRKCHEVIKLLVDENECQSMGFDYCLSRMSVPTRKLKFMAFSSFYYVVSYFEAKGSLEDYLNASYSFCSLSYKQIEKKARDKSELNHLLTYCFGAVYVYEVLTSAYGFDNSTWQNIAFEQDIKGADVGWSLGFMINASNAIPEEAPQPPILGLLIFIPLLAISLLLIFISFMLIKQIVKFNASHDKDYLLEL